MLDTEGTDVSRFEDTIKSLEPGLAISGDCQGVALVEGAEAFGIVPDVTVDAASAVEDTVASGVDDTTDLDAAKLDADSMVEAVENEAAEAAVDWGSNVKAVDEFPTNKVVGAVGVSNLEVIDATVGRAPIVETDGDPAAEAAAEVSSKLEAVDEWSIGETVGNAAVNDGPDLNVAEELSTNEAVELVAVVDCGTNFVPVNELSNKAIEDPIAVDVASILELLYKSAGKPPIAETVGKTAAGVAVNVTS